MTRQSQYKKKFRNHCRNDAKAWGECLKRLKEKEKDELFLEEMSPGHHLNSLGNMFDSPCAKQDSTNLSPFWNLKEKSEEQMATQKLPYPKISEGHFQQKHDQLFWGLPSLHSESLVAAPWIPQTTSTLPSPFFLFNVISSVYPIQLQDEMSPMLPQTHSLSYLDLQPPPLILSPLEFQPPALNQVHFQSPLPVLLPSSLPYNRDFGTSYSQSQSKPQYFPTETKYRERTSPTKLESKLTLPLMVQNPQEAYDILAPNPSEDWVDSILPNSFTISCELREKLEQHIQKWLNQHQWNFPHKIQDSEERIELQNTVTGNCQIRDKPGTSQTPVSIGEHRKEDQKVKFQQEKESVKKLGPILGKISKDSNRGLDKSIVKGLGTNTLESGRTSIKYLKSDSRNDLTNHIDKDLQNNLNTHLVTKSGQINQALTPLSMRQSWLAVDSSFYETDIHMGTRNLKSSEESISSPEKLAFLNPETRKALEAHIVRSRVKHRWGLPLKILKPINLFKLKHIEALPVALCAQPSSTTSVHGTSSTVEVVGVLGKPCLRQMIIKDSSPSPGNLPVSSPCCKRAMRRLPSSVDHEPSTALPTKPESRYFSETLTYNFMDTPSQSQSDLKEEIETLEVLLLPRRTSAPNPEAHNLQAKVIEFPHNVETELASPPQIYTTAVLLPKHTRSMLLPVDTLTSHVLCDIVVVDGDNGLVQQRSSTPKHQVSQKGQMKVLAPTYQEEDTKRQCERKYEDRSTFTTVKEKEINFGSQYYKIIPKTTQILQESPSQRLLGRFRQWIQPKKTIKCQESHSLKVIPTAATAQNQQRQVRKKLYMDNNIAETQKLLTAVRQMLEKKMMLQHQFCPSKFNQHREVPPAPTSQFFHGHRPVSYLWQRRAPRYPANSSCQRCSIQDRHIRDQLSQKRVQFSKKPQIPRNPRHLYPNSALNPVNSSQNRTIVPGIPNHHLYCPRHCALQRNVHRELGHSSVGFSSRRT